MRDAAVIARLERNDPRVLRRLVRQYGGLLWTVCAACLPRHEGFTSHDVEQCVGDAFLAIAQNPQAFDPQRGSLKTFLCSIARNKAISLYRAKSRCCEDCIDEEGLASLFSDACEAESSDDGLPRAVFAVVDKMSDPTREILLRRLFLEQKPAVIAQALGLSVKEVNNRLYRGKAHVRKMLSHTWGVGFNNEVTKGE